MSTIVQSDVLSVGFQYLSEDYFSEVLEIERLSYSNPCSAKHLRVVEMDNYFGMVTLSASNQVAGYFIYYYTDEFLELINLAVHPKFRRRRVGTQMIERLRSRLSPERHVLRGLVGERDLEAQLFLRFNNFRAARSFVSDDTEAAYDMTYVWHPERDTPEEFFSLVKVNT